MCLSHKWWDFFFFFRKERSSVSPSEWNFITSFHPLCLLKRFTSSSTSEQRSHLQWQWRRHLGRQSAYFKPEESEAPDTLSHSRTSKEKIKGKGGGARHETEKPHVWKEKTRLTEAGQLHSARGRVKFFHKICMRPCGSRVQSEPPPPWRSGPSNSTFHTYTNTHTQAKQMVSAALTAQRYMSLPATLVTWHDQKEAGLQ